MNINKISSITTIIVILVCGCNSKEEYKENNNDINKQVEIEISPPSFEIFREVSPSCRFNELIELSDINEFELCLQEVINSDSTITNKFNLNKISNLSDMAYIMTLDLYSGIIPLYNKKQWTEKEKEIGINTSRLISIMMNVHSLEITDNDNKSIKIGLKKLKDWFIVESNKDHVLACMLWSLESGFPLFGLEVESIKECNLIKEKILSHKSGKVDVLIDEYNNLVISHVLEDNSIDWIRYITDHTGAAIKITNDLKYELKYYKNYGYLLSLYRIDPYRDVIVYLDKNNRLRFYFVVSL